MYEIWREIAGNLELDAALQRIHAVLARQMPLASLLVREILLAPPHLVTAAVGCAGEAPAAVRTDLDPGQVGRLVTWCRRNAADRARRGDGGWLGEIAIPHGEDGEAIVGPLTSDAGPIGLAVWLAEPGRRFRPDHLSTAEALLGALVTAFANGKRVREMERARQAMEADKDALLSRLARQDISDTMIGSSANFREVVARAEQVAPTDAPVLILGETGTGKEVIARAIHARSRRSGGPLFRVNCGAIPTELVDSELFGHERGSFTGAVASRKGWFERADGGTLFLDEIGDLPPAAQVRLLRVLQDGSMERVGGQRTIQVDVRVVAATNADLGRMVADGRFREDLWYRISVFPIRLPPLRERPEDIPDLAAHFAWRAGKRLGGTPLSVSADDVRLLVGYGWPGNVRELAAVIERAAIIGDGKRLDIPTALGRSDPGAPRSREPRAAQPAVAEAAVAPEAMSPDDAPGHGAMARFSPLDEIVVRHVEQALARCHGRVEGPAGAAAALGLNPNTLRAKMRKLGIDWRKFKGKK
ncbi:MAG: sigma 54-interacting transcriptional regulator [Proteobacteria bacterium]|nr:sigma 54-interacting transcriptional regulator [Pseudomonadota bacterium]